MRRRSLMPEETVAPVNATPLIDVVLCMIVFFLIVGRLAESQSIAGIASLAVSLARGM